MAKKIKLEVTEAQLRSICNAADTLSGLIGTGGDFDADARHTVRMIDRLLYKNGYKRGYN